jgi:glycosyltransferase involved in cell wall biosynthesis
VPPLVSIVILSYNHPAITEICLRTLKEHTSTVEHEVIVVDNGSDHETVQFLRTRRDAGEIDKLVESPENLLFSAGNNLGVAHADPASDYVLMLNSDVAFLHDSWLPKLIGWMEGTIQYEPCVWNAHPTQPDPGPRDIVSCGWSHDANVEGRVRPEGWCCLFRRSAWRDLSPDFPWHYGFEEAISLSVRAGFKCGVLFNYSRYLIHREGGSGSGPQAHDNKRWPDLTGWYSGIRIESLDFTLGPNEHDSYLQW